VKHKQKSIFCDADMTCRAFGHILGNVVPVQNKLTGGTSGVSGPRLVQNADALVKQAASSSSREQSEDDDMEGEDEITGNGVPTDQRLRRR
jgi:hypothetical protein